MLINFANMFNIKKSFFSLIFVGISMLGGVFGQNNAPIPPEIENPELLGINKEPYHATLMP